MIHKLTLQNLGFTVVITRFLAGTNFFQAPPGIGCPAASGGRGKVVVVIKYPNDPSCLRIPLFTSVLPRFCNNFWVDGAIEYGVFHVTTTIECHVTVVRVRTCVLGIGLFSVVIN